MTDKRGKKRLSSYVITNGDIGNRFGETISCIKYFFSLLYSKCLKVMMVFILECTFVQSPIWYYPTQLPGPRCLCERRSVSVIHRVTHIILHLFMSSQQSLISLA